VSIGLDKGKPPCQQQQLQKNEFAIENVCQKEIFKLLSFPSTAGKKRKKIMKFLKGVLT
jgi:hypothetical protein